MSRTKIFDEPRFEVVALGQGEERTLLVHDTENRLGKVVQVSARKSPDEIKIKLEPCVIVRGRLVDDNETPISGARVRFSPRPVGDFSPKLENATTDEQGRFEHAGVLPGTTYNVMAESVQEGFAVLAEELAVEPGETVDLGVIDVTAKQRPGPKRTSAKPVEAAAGVDVSSSAAELQGVVVGSDGKPVAGAEFFYFNGRGHDPDPMRPVRVGASDSGGRFRFALPEIIPPADTPNSWSYYHWLIVKAPGHGVVIERPANVRRLMNNASFTGGTRGAVIELPHAGEPLSGRIVDVDGRGVAGALVRVRWMLDGEDAKRRMPTDGSNPERAKLQQLLGNIEPWQLSQTLPSAKTDEQGAFELRAWEPIVGCNS